MYRTMFTYIYVLYIIHNNLYNNLYSICLRLIEIKRIKKTKKKIKYFVIIIISNKN